MAKGHTDGNDTTGGFRASRCTLARRFYDR
jgi:hypothetical protein